jgi:hypothetical protein
LFNFYEKAELQAIGKIGKTWSNPLNWKKNLTRIAKERMDDDMIM